MLRTFNTIYNRKKGQQRIQYNDAVEEALCFGWIDSINKTLDKDHTIQRFTPRQSKSSYSQPNKERLKWLAKKNYKDFSDCYKRIRIAYIDGARKRPKEFTKRLTNFIQKTQDNKLISGFGGIDKYY